MNPLLLARTQMANPLFVQQQQQQRLAMQQRGLGPSMLQRAHGQGRGRGRLMETGPHPLATPHGIGRGAHVIPSGLLTATIASLRVVMASNDQAKVTAAINEAFIKLGANDAESKRKVLEQLVAASTKDNNNDSGHGQTDGKEKEKHR